MMNKTMYAVNEQGNPVARLALAEGIDELDAEMFVLRGGVPGAIGVAEDGSESKAALVEAFKAQGYAEDVAVKMAGGEDLWTPDPITVPKWTPNPRFLPPARAAESRRLEPTRRSSASEPSARGQKIEIREAIASVDLGRVDYGGGRVYGVRNGKVIR